MYAILFYSAVGESSKRQRGGGGNVVEYLREKATTEATLKREELKLREDELKLRREQFELEREERKMKLEAEKKEKEMLFGLMTSCVKAAGHIPKPQ